MVPAPIGLKRGRGSSTTDRKFCSTDRGGARHRSRSAAAAAALNDHQKLAASTMLSALTRARDLLGPPGRCSGWWRHVAPNPATNNSTKTNGAAGDLTIVRPAAAAPSRRGPSRPRPRVRAAKQVKAAKFR